MNFEKELVNICEFNNIGITGLTNQLISFSVNSIYNNSKRDIFVLTNSLYEANIIYSSLSKLNKNTFLFPMDDFLTSEALAISPELKSIRLLTLNSLCEKNTNKIVITNLMGALRYLPSKKIWKESIFSIKKGEILLKEKFINKLFELGYSLEPTVNKSGEFSNRGFVVDIFPLISDYPVRIEFWGDEIDSIRYFDIDTQRSIKEINEVIITPNSEFINQKNIEIENKQKYLPYVIDDITSIFDYLNNPITIFKDYTQIKNSYNNLRNEIFEYSISDNNHFKTNYMFNLDEIKIKNKIYLLSLDSIIADKKLDKIYNLKGKNIDNFKSNIDLIRDYIILSLKNNKLVIISLDNEDKVKKIKKYLEIQSVITSKDNINFDKINIIISDYNEGFETDKYVLLTEKELYNQNHQKLTLNNKFKVGTKINSINNLSVGDYVVHINHGIGVYKGIKTLVKNGNKKDYLEVAYLGTDKLYIPVEKIDLISKYSGKEGISPKINKLGGTEWEKTKLRIKNRIKNIADKLLKIQAQRQMKKGFAFNEDDELQKEFESEFPYELTKDQFISLNKIKSEMQKSNPMDMLLCGDVGYGKTEVAFRAIFKAIASGKQVGYLCPTTILSNQQYSNAVERFKNYGVEIALINRFTSPKESKRIINSIKEGKIDLLFGTHRLLSNDIQFKDLGLLVIDEEQRFGVMHKEKIKEYKSSIDVLTLSATPIPRTLQMSLVGIRSLALIETPPAARYPVQTYVVEESNQIIKEAIYKELSRGGQVFILFNSIEKIEEKLYEIKNLVPESDIRIAHGQMNKIQIENTMNSFINNEFNILLCTTIIETGIDIPNVNTLIIYDSDKFGLSQLYQIRGRVGRSNKIAYSYLLYKNNKILNELAIKRLNAIKEFTELGSGFSIAMRDLSIRGAGDILGSEQAGFIDSVGYDLYLKLLNDEVNRLKGLPIKEEIIENEKPLLEITTHIDDDYVSNDSLKIEIHKLINNIDSFEKIISSKEELEDRFGKINQNMEIYMYSEWFEKMAKKLNITNIEQNRLFVEFSLDNEILNSLNVSDLFVEASKINMNFKFNYKFNRLYIKLTLANLEKHFIYYLTELLNKINSMLV